MTHNRHDAFTDAVALVRASHARDREAVHAIINHCDTSAVLAELVRAVLQIGAAAYGDETELDGFLHSLQERARDTAGST